MTVKLNRAGLEHAKQLLDERSYIINTQWGRTQPGEKEERAYLEQHGEDEYAKWFLAVDPDEQPGSRERYKFPYGDFRKVHHSGLVAAKQRAAQNDYDEIVQAADELLDIFDRMNAC